jgi:hypothetical protein
MASFGAKIDGEDEDEPVDLDGFRGYTIYHGIPMYALFSE